MIIVTKYIDVWVGVLGLGMTGKACILSILSGGGWIAVWEDNKEAVESFVAMLNNPTTDAELLLAESFTAKRLLINPNPQEYICNLAAMIPSPGITPKHKLLKLCIKLNVPIVSDIDLMQQVCNQARYIGVTGTNGKSTTTALIGHILNLSSIIHQVGGNIGVPALALNPLDENGIYVLELSSFQLELCQESNFNIAILLNITPDHMDRYSSLTGYAQAKNRIFRNQGFGDIAIVQADSGITLGVIQVLNTTGVQGIAKFSTISSVNCTVCVINGILYDTINDPLEFVLDLPPALHGPHNAENIAAAYIACRCINIPPENIIKALSTFSGLPHRMEVVHKTSDGLVFVNDSKATNSHSTGAALASYISDIIWIAGGISKDDGLEPLAHLFNRLKYVYLIGEAAQKFAEVLAGYGVPHTVAETLENALQFIKEEDYKTGTVLLSPACSSLDQWKNYEERGGAFTLLVRKHWS